MTPILETHGVSRDFRTARGDQRLIHAVRDVTLSLSDGERVGLIGQSGSGKTTLTKIVLGLTKPTSGEVLHHGIPLAKTSSTQFRREVQVVFQDPRSSLDPMMRIAEIVGEPLQCLGIEGDHDARVREVLSAVGLGADHLDRRPHQLSGGQRQRVAIARALAPRPALIVADEPVSALDAVVRDEILDLLERLVTEMNLALLLVSHDLSVIARLCPNVLVMHDGEIVERGETAAVFGHPHHAETGALLAAAPRFS